MAWLAVVSFLSVVYETYAEYCGDSIYCHAPYKCCETKKGCCYDSMLHNSKHFRLQIWNMWYFWFLIIFMMMSCFGGCGYYRRRRLAMLTRGSSPPPTRPNLVLGPSQRRPRSRSQEGSSRQFNFFAYNGPGVNPTDPSTNLPPAYAEVISQPGLYPVNKVELPPYPGNDKPEDGEIMYGSAMVPHDCRTLPPPYSEYQYDPPVPPSSQSASLPPLQPQRDISSSQGNPDQSPTVPAERANESIGQSNATSSDSSVTTDRNNTNSH